MRLWTIHPKYLDRQGLTALWREGLGALTSLHPSRGYYNHPQLNRFKKCTNSKDYLKNYMYFVWEEASSRDYNFNLDKLGFIPFIKNRLVVDKSQISFEINHLYSKMKKRSIPQFSKSVEVEKVLLNPIFTLGGK